MEAKLNQALFSAFDVVFLMNKMMLRVESVRTGSAGSSNNNNDPPLNINASNFHGFLSANPERFDSNREMFRVAGLLPDCPRTISPDLTSTLLSKWWSITTSCTVHGWREATRSFDRDLNSAYAHDVLFDAVVAQYSTTLRFSLVRAYLPMIVSSYPWHMKSTRSPKLLLRADRPDVWSIMKPAVPRNVTLYSLSGHTLPQPHSDSETDKEARKRMYSKRKKSMQKEKVRKKLPLRYYTTHPSWKPILEFVDEKFKNHPHSNEMNDLFGPEIQKMFETVLVGIVGIMNSENNTNRMAILALVFSNLTGKSLTSEIINFFSSLFDTQFPHSEEKNSESFVGTSFLRSNWKTLKNHRMFERFSTLMSAMVSMGMCQASGLTWSINGLTLFDPLAKTKNMGAFDVIDAFVDTCLFFFEAGHMCFKKKSLKPLMYGDQLAAEFDELYVELEVYMAAYRCGNTAHLDKEDCDISKSFDRAIEIAAHLVQTTESPYEKAFYKERHLRMCKARSEFITHVLGSDLREAPFTILVHGSSGVGKSTVSRMIASVVLKHNGFSTDPEQMAYLNEADKFYSNYRTSVNAVFLDDMCNTKPQFLDGAPTEKVLRVANNTPEYANMADVAQKGQVMIRPKVFIVTTNVKNVNAPIFSMEPVAILRRFQYIITVEVKPEFERFGQLDSDKVSAMTTSDNPYVDAWKFTVEEVHGTKQGEYRDVNFRTLEGSNGLMDRVDINSTLSFLCDKSREHFQRQRNVLTHSARISELAEPCSNCRRWNCSQRDGECMVGRGPVVYEEVPEEPNTPHASVSNSYFLSWMFPKLWKYLIREAQITYTWWFKPLSKWTDSELVRCSTLIGDYLNENYVYMLPTWFIESDTGKRFVQWAETKRSHDRHPFFRFFETVVKYPLPSSLLTIPAYAFSKKCPLLAIPCWAAVAYYAYKYAMITKSCRSYEELLAKNQMISAYTKGVRDHAVTTLIAGSVVLGGFYAFFKMYKAGSAFLTIPHTIDPKSKDDILERDKQVNPWMKVDSDRALVPGERDQRTITDEALSKKIARNIFHMTYTYEGGKTGACNVIFLSSCVGIMPKHIWHDKYWAGMMMGRRQRMGFECRKSKAVGGLRKFVLNYNDLVEVAPDLLMFYTASVGEHADITTYLQVADFKDVPATLLYRDSSYDIQEHGAHLISGKVSHVGASFQGAEVTATTSLLKGMCMAPYISRGKSKFLAGFHIGGTSDTRGIAIRLTKSDYERGLTKLREYLPHTLDVPPLTDVPETRYGKDIFVEGPLPAKSPVNFLEEETPLRVLGPCKGASSPKSRVVDTVLSKHFEEVMDFKPCWGPPKLKPKGEPWKPWRNTLVHLANPAINMPHDDMRWAVSDYLRPLKAKVRHKMFHEYLQPLSRLHVVSGIDGVRFIDRMAPNTSTGMYLGGPKSKYLLPVISEDETVTVKTTFPDFIWDEFEKAEEMLKQGSRPGTVFKACLKDEPTRLDKEKVRVFEASELLLQLLLRKYYLPIARFLSLIPLESECAVGVNSAGPEWEELHQHMTKFGEDRILAGDYSKYDLRMPADAVMAAFSVMIEIARASGNYSEEDLKVMSILSSEVIFPFVAYNGVLIQLLGSNPSGQNLTVYVNSIVNSLQMRCAWHHIYGGAYDFRTFVRIATYGDDVKGSVHTSKSKFNCVSVSEYFGLYDQVFTPPDKTSELVPYRNDKNSDFLKRSSVYIDELQQHVGALDKESIYKMLCCAMEDSDLTPSEQAVQNARTAAEEFFFHNKTIYDTERYKIKRLLAKSDLVCPDLDIPFEERVKMWKTKYRPKVTESSHSGAAGFLDFVRGFWDKTS